MNYIPKDPTILEAVELVRGGMSVPKAADVFGVSMDTVKYAMIKLGVKSNAKPTRRVTDQELKRIRTLAAQGINKNEIARRVGLSYRTVSRYAQV